MMNFKNKKQNEFSVFNHNDCDDDDFFYPLYL